MNRLSCLLAVLILFPAVSASQASGAEPGDSPANPWSIAPLARNYFSSDTSYEFGNPAPPYQTPLSRLEFPLNSWWAGAEVKRNFSRFSVGIEAMRNISGEADGQFKDSDWDDEARPGVKTIYSESNLRTDPSYTVRGDVDLKISGWVGLPTGFDLRPVVGFRWQRLSFVSHDGLQVYPAPGDNTPSLPLPGDGIRFKQTYWQTFLGVRTAYEWERPRYVSRLGLRMQMDWAYVLGDNEDHHLLRAGERFTYEKTSGDAWHASLGLDIGLTQRLSVSFDADYLRLDTTGSHRWLNTLFGEDTSSNYAVKVWSQQASFTMGVKYAF